MNASTIKSIARRTTVAAAVSAVAMGTLLTGVAGAAPAWSIPDVSPKPYQIVGDVEKFFDLGNYDKVSPSGAHWCQAEGRDDLMGTIAGRMWTFVEDYTTDAESLYKNSAEITVSGWTDGRVAFGKFINDRLMCTWLEPQRRLTWGDKNPERFWLSTGGKVGTRYQYTAAMRIDDMIVSVTSHSTSEPTARRMATRMAVAVERNVRATDLVRAGD